MTGGVDGGIGSYPRWLGVKTILEGGEEGRARVGVGYRSSFRAGSARGIKR